MEVVRYGTEVRAGYECFCAGFGYVCLFAFYLFLCLFLHLLTLLFRKNMPSADGYFSRLLHSCLGSTSFHL